jgi:FixJ family two-component response regulator
MEVTSENILIVETNREISDLISRQALRPMGYRVRVVREVTAGIEQALANPPDLIIANLNLQDLSATDLLSALRSKSVQVPVVVVAEKGRESRIIQAFRLGAADALLWPARDTEIVRVVERALDQTRQTRMRQQLNQQLEITHRELESKYRDLSTLIGISKAMLAVTDQPQLFGRILDGALQISEADIAWLMLKDERSREFLLRAHRNLPSSWARKIGQPLDDGLSSMVSMSGQSLSIHGKPLERFNAAPLGKSTAVVPIKVKSQVVGILMVMRKADRDIDKNTVAMLEAVADFTSIALVNGRLFQALDQTADSVKAGERSGAARLDALRGIVRDELRIAANPLENLLSGKFGTLTETQRRALAAIQTSLQRLAHSARNSNTTPRSKSN